MKKSISFFLLIISAISCKSDKYTNVEIKREYKNYRTLIYKFEDSTEVIIPFVFKIINNSNKELELNPIKPKRQVTFLTEQHTINKNNELKSFFFKNIKSKDSLIVVVFGSKKVKNDDLEFSLDKEKSLADYMKTITIENNQDIRLKETDFYKKIVKKIEKDSIFFQFTNQDKTIWFLKCGTIEGKTFITDDKSHDKWVN